MNGLEELKSLLTQSNMLNFADLDVETAEEMLDSRDSQEFETDWLRIFQILEQKRFSANELLEIEKIREIAYKKTFAATGISDLAAYAADDFELFAKSLLADFSDEWLNALFLIYLHGMFPHSKIAPKRSGIELILETASLQKIAA